MALYSFRNLFNFLLFFYFVNVFSISGPVAPTEDNDSKERSARGKISQVGNNVTNIIRNGWGENILDGIATDKIALLFFAQALLTHEWTLPALSV